MSTGSLQAAVGHLRSLLDRAAHEEGFRTIPQTKQSVYTRYQPLFAPENIGRLSDEEFKGFLHFENNRHWKGLQRQGPKICADMAKLRSGVAALVDETQPLKARLDLLRSKSGPLIPGLNRAVITAILHVTHLEKYGVWNNTSQAELTKVGAWPSFERGDSFGER